MKQILYDMGPLTLLKPPLNDMVINTKGLGSRTFHTKGTGVFILGGWRVKVRLVNYLSPPSLMFRLVIKHFF